MFNEGVDVPNIDTVMMLRPTESKVLWLQQVGRGLRKAEDKERLVVIDYIGNHKSFLMKPQALLGLSSAHHELLRALAELEEKRFDLPPGCEVTYELESIDILRGLLRPPPAGDALRTFFEEFQDRHGVRPSAVEAYHEGYSLKAVRPTHESWFGFVRSLGGLSSSEQRALQRHGDFLRALETTQMSRSFKMVLLMAMLNEDAFPGEISIEILRVRLLKWLPNQANSATT